MRFKIIAPALAVFLGLSTSAMAGSPDSPGAGGQAVKNAVGLYKESGTNFGAAVSTVVQSGGNLGKEIQTVKEYAGGDPNPDNDIATAEAAAIHQLADQSPGVLQVTHDPVDFPF